MKKTKKNEPKYLKLYYDFWGNGLPNRGLCNSLLDRGFQLDLLKLVSPFDEYSAMYSTFWGDDALETEERIKNAYSFIPLRQNLVLLMAALNNEL